MTVSVAEALRMGAARLSPIADNPRREARLVLAHALGLQQTDLVRDPDRQVDTGVFDRLITRRTTREPLALITGRREFWSMDFEVSRATLVPRPDSETLIEAALTSRPAPSRILDLGTGTGCLLLALLRECPDAFGIGVDVSADATALAKRNAAQNGLAERSAFICGDWTNAVAGTFDLVVSNPPYISHPEMADLMPEVADYEPRLALDGGRDGYDAYRAILPRLHPVLAPEGVAILEVGAGQADVVAGMAKDRGFSVSLRPDLAGVARAVTVSRP